MRAVNLIPAEQRSGASVGAGRSQGGAYAVLALVAGVALLAFLYGHAHHEVNSRKAKAASIDAQAARAHAQAEQLAPYTSFVALQQQRQQAVDTLVDSRFDWAHAFHEFGRVLSATTSITSLSGSIGSNTSSVSASSSSSSSSSSTSSGSAVASATPPGSVPAFTVVGCAISQPAVAQMLQRLRLIDGVSDVQLQSSSRGSGGGAGGSCPEGDPAFTVQIGFDALPASSSASSSTATGSGAATAASTSATSTPAGSTAAGSTAQVSVR